MGALSPLDPSSFSRPGNYKFKKKSYIYLNLIHIYVIYKYCILELAVIKHVSLSYKVDFDEKILYGSAILNIEVIDYIDNVVSKTFNLYINVVEIKVF